LTKEQKIHLSRNLWIIYTKSNPLVGLDDKIDEVSMGKFKLNRVIKDQTKLIKEAIK